MNADNVTNATPSSSGALFIAPANTSLPTDASTALAAAFKNIGYITTDGLKRKVNRESSQWDTWEADDVAEVSSSHSIELSFTLMEPFAAEAAKMLYGSANVTVGTGGAVTAINDKGADYEEVVLVADCVTRNGGKLRIVVGRFKVTGEGETTFKRSDPITTEVTGKALALASGVKMSYYLAAPATSGGSGSGGSGGSGN